MGKIDRLMYKALKSIGSEFANINKNMPWYKQLWWYLYLENEVMEWYLHKVWYRLCAWKQNVLRILDWIPTLWKDRDWDWIFLLKILRKKLTGMEKSMRESPLLNGPKYADEIKLANNLIDRLLEKDYYGNAKKTRLIKNVNPALHSDYMEDQDVEYLFNHIKKNLRKWWN